MVSEGESGHQGHSDPPQPRQQGPQRRRHPAGRRSGRMKRARVVEDRAMQRAAEDPSASTQPFTLACTTPWAKVKGSWLPNPAGRQIAQAHSSRGSAPLSVLSVKSVPTLSLLGDFKRLSLGGYGGLTRRGRPRPPIIHSAARRRKPWEGGCEPAAADPVVKIIMHKKYMGRQPWSRSQDHEVGSVQR